MMCGACFQWKYAYHMYKRFEKKYFILRLLDINKILTPPYITDRGQRSHLSNLRSDKKNKKNMYQWQRKDSFLIVFSESPFLEVLRFLNKWFNQAWTIFAVIQRYIVQYIAYYLYSILKLYW